MGSFVYWVQEDLLSLQALTKTIAREEMSKYGFGDDQMFNLQLRKRLIRGSHYIHWSRVDENGVCYFPSSIY